MATFALENGGSGTNVRHRVALFGKAHACDIQLAHVSLHIVYTYTYTMYVCIFACMYVSTLCMYIYAYAYVYIYKYMCMYIYATV